MNQENRDLDNLFIDLKREGKEAQELKWRKMGLAAILLRTKSGAYYIVEPKDEGEHSLVTRISEKPPSVIDAQDSPRTMFDSIVRRPAEPDEVISVGSRAVFWGISHRDMMYDIESSLTTTPIETIRYIE